MCETKLLSTNTVQLLFHRDDIVYHFTVACSLFSTIKLPEKIVEIPYLS